MEGFCNAENLLDCVRALSRTVNLHSFNSKACRDFSGMVCSVVFPYGWKASHTAYAAAADSGHDALVAWSWKVTCWHTRKDLCG